MKELVRRFLDHRIVASQETIEPAKRVDMQLLRVLMRTLGDLQTEIITRFVKLIDVPHLAMNVDNAFQREDRVLVGV